MALTYTQLKSDLIEYLENNSTEFAAIQDRIIRNVETSIYRKADLNVFRKTSTATITSGDPSWPRPDDYVVDRVLKLTIASVATDLIPKDVSFIQTYWPTVATTGEPKYYADWDHDTFVMAPTPTLAYVATLGFTYRPQSIVDSATTSWLGDNAQDLLLYGCIVEAYGFSKLTENTQDLQYWQAKYEDALAALKFEEETRQRREEMRQGVIR